MGVGALQPAAHPAAVPLAISRRTTDRSFGNVVRELMTDIMAVLMDT